MTMNQRENKKPITYVMGFLVDCTVQISNVNDLFSDLNKLEEFMESL